MKTKSEVSAGGIVFKTINNPPSTVHRPLSILWLICQHSQHKGWVFPKGLIGDSEKNETMKTAALREVEEEGGVKAKIINNKPIQVSYIYQWLCSPHGGKTGEKILVNKTVFYYLMEYISGDPKNHDWEMSDAKFVTKEEVKNTLTFKSDQEAFEKILKSIIL
jgi:8-oxo-dGTP pyrophosphatase MutT (NUDIX family)